MVIRGRAPLRVSFGGGGTDVAPFCEEQGGAIIGSTINKYAYCSIVPREDDQIIVHSLDFDMTVKYNTKENYVYDGRLDLVTAALKAMEISQGCEVYLQCDAPPGSGLGTSSTVMVAMLTAMARWKGIMMDAYAMADLAYQVERLDLKGSPGRFAGLIPIFIVTGCCGIASTRAIISVAIGPGRTAFIRTPVRP